MITGLQMKASQLNVFKESLDGQMPHLSAGIEELLGDAELIVLTNEVDDIYRENNARSFMQYYFSVKQTLESMLEHVKMLHGFVAPYAHHELLKAEKLAMKFVELFREANDWPYSIWISVCPDWELNVSYDHNTNYAVLHYRGENLTLKDSDWKTVIASFER